MISRENLHQFNAPVRVDDLYLPDGRVVQKIPQGGYIFIYHRLLPQLLPFVSRWGLYGVVGRGTFTDQVVYHRSGHGDTVVAFHAPSELIDPATKPEWGAALNQSGELDPDLIDALNRYYRETPITCFGTLAQIFVQNHADGLLGHLSPSFIDWRESLRATLVYNHPTHDQAKVAFDKFDVNFVQPWQDRFLAALSFGFGPDEEFPYVLNHFAQK